MISRIYWCWCRGFEFFGSVRASSCVWLSFDPPLSNGSRISAPIPSNWVTMSSDIFHGFDSFRQNQYINVCLTGFHRPHPLRQRHIVSGFDKVRLCLCFYASLPDCITVTKIHFLLASLPHWDKLYKWIQLGIIPLNTKKYHIIPCAEVRSTEYNTAFLACHTNYIGCVPGISYRICW